MAKANIKNILKNATRDKSTRRIILNVAIVSILSYLTFYFSKELLHDIAFVLTPHHIGYEGIICFEYEPYILYGRTINCGEQPSIYTNLLFYVFYIFILFLYSLAAGLSSRPKYKILGRTIFYSILSVIVITLLIKLLQIIF